MPLKVNLGLSKKVGLPRYGSLGASCHLEIEVEASLLQQDLGAFHRHVQNAYAACREAVQHELARQEALETAPDEGRSPNGGYAESSSRPPLPHEPSSGRPVLRRLATPAQIRALKAIATRQRLNIEQILADQYGPSQLEQLTVSDASQLIDQLNRRVPEAAS